VSVGGLGVTAISIYSRKLHGAAGPFDLLIDDSQGILGAVTIEPRAGIGGHSIVFTFNGDVSAHGSATVSVPSATAVAGPGAAANEVIVTLTNVPDGQRATISLTGVNGSAAKSVSLGFLLGDVNNSGLVDSHDVSIIKSRSGQTANLSNFLMDLNATGVIGSADIAATKARNGRLLQ
jgi:hypothetical protein